MLLSMGVSLYTSRVVLNVLGIMDYGLWNIVAGVIAMFSFLNASISGSTSRFLSYELGKGEKGNIQKTFSSAIFVHICVAACVLFLGESIGLWFLQNKLVIPEDRLIAANIIYQISIISVIINILQLPYNALIIAKEHMNIYAYIEIINVLLKLFIVELLLIVNTDKLITYGIFTLIITLLIAMLYYFYCTTKIKQCSFTLHYDKKVIIPMLSFSSWDLYGNLSVIARTQGVNILLNIFFTTAMNAASGIASQVQGAVMSFANNILVAFKPQIIKSYAQGDMARMNMLINKASTFTFVLLLLFTIPLYIEIDYILILWLKNPPAYTSIFIKYVLIFNLIANLSSVVISGIHATGKIKRASFINGSLYLLVIPFAYVSYKLNGGPQSAYLFNIFAVIGGLSQNIYCLSHYVPNFSKLLYIKNITKCCIIGAFVYVLVYNFSILMDASFLRLLTIITTSWALLFLATYFILLNKKEQQFIMDKLSDKIRRK